MCCKLLCHCPHLSSIIIDILFPASLGRDGSIYTRKGTKATDWGLTHSMLIMQILLFNKAFLLELCFVKVKWLQTQESYKHQENRIKIFVYSSLFLCYKPHIFSISKICEKLTTCIKRHFWNWAFEGLPAPTSHTLLMDRCIAQCPNNEPKVPLCIRSSTGDTLPISMSQFFTPPSVFRQGATLKGELKLPAMLE